MKLNITVFAALKTRVILLLLCFLFQGDPQCKAASSLLFPSTPTELLIKVQKHKKMIHLPLATNNCQGEI